MPISIDFQENSKYEVIKFSNSEKFGSVNSYLSFNEERLVVKNAATNMSGAYICITGHMYSVRFHVSILEVTDDGIIGSTPLNIYHFSVLSGLITTIIIFALIGFYILLKYFLQTKINLAPTEIANVEAKSDLLTANFRRKSSSLAAYSRDESSGAAVKSILNKHLNENNNQSPVKIIMKENVIYSSRSL